VAARYRIDQRVQCFEEGRSRFGDGLASGADIPNAIRHRRFRVCLPLLEFANTLGDRVACQACGLSGKRYAAPTQRDRFACRPLSANPFFHDGIQGCEFLPNPFKLLDLLDVRAFEGPGLSAVVEGGVAVLEELFEPGVELVG